MAKKGETNMDRLNRHKAELIRAHEIRKKWDDRITHLENTIAQETNQEYLLMLSSASITLDDLRQIVEERRRKQNASVPAAAPKELMMKENKENEHE